MTHRSESPNDVLMSSESCAELKIQLYTPTLNLHTDFATILKPYLT